MSGGPVARWAVGLPLLVAAFVPACLLSIDDSAADRRRPASASPDAAPDDGTSSRSADGGSAGTGAAPVPGLVGYWSFDEATGDVVGDATGRFAGRLVGATVRGTGIKGSCIELTGAQSFGVDALGGTAFPPVGTLTFYFRPRQALASGDPGGLFDVEDDTRSHVAVVPIAAGFGQFTADFAPAATTTLFSVATSEWHWLAITWSTSRGEVFVNGISQHVEDLAAFVPSGQRFVFGTRFLGAIDEIALYDRVMDVASLPRTR